MDDLVLLVGLIICVASAVASAWFARKNNVRELRADVDILSENAEKVLRTARTARMREVRAATRAPDTDTAPPPELQTPTPTPSADIKSTLRRQVFSSKH